jgi:hypothetical protein
MKSTAALVYWSAQRKDTLLDLSHYSLASNPSRYLMALGYVRYCEKRIRESR